MVMVGSMPHQIREMRKKYIEQIEEIIERRDQTPHLWNCLKGGENRKEYVDALRLLYGGFDLDTPKIQKVRYWLSGADLIAPYTG